MKTIKHLLSLALLVPVLALAAPGDMVDHSGTITSGGTSQTLAAADPTRGAITITNPSTESEVLCVNVTSAASCSTPGSWLISPGGSLTLKTGELVTVVAATTGHKFTAKSKAIDAILVNPGSGAGGGGDASAANQTTMIASLSVMDDWDESDRAKVNPVVGQAGVAAGAGAITSNTQRVVGADSGTIASASCAAACNSTTLLAADMTGYESGIFQVTAAGTGTLTGQTSCDSTNGTDGTWVSAAVQQPQAAGNNSHVPVTTITATGAYQFPRYCKWIRLQFTAYTSGTFTAQGELRKGPMQVVAPGVVITGQTYAPIVVTASTTTGAAAHDAPISGNPVRTGGRAVTSNYTAVATGDTADIVTTLVGAQITKPYSIPEADWQYAAASGGITDTADVTLAAAPAAGLRNYLTRLDVCNTHASVDTEVVVKDGSTVLWRRMFKALAVGCLAVTLNTPIRQPTTATALTAAAITTGSATYINAGGYVAP